MNICSLPSINQIYCYKPEVQWSLKMSNVRVDNNPDIVSDY